MGLAAKNMALNTTLGAPMMESEDASDSIDFVAGVITLEELGDRVLARYKVPKGYDWGRIENVVLYDMFYEAGTQLGGVLIALQDQAEAANDKSLAAQWHTEDLEMGRGRAAVRVDDRQAQISTMLGWQRRARDLRRLVRR
jgi:hypothetical protein